MAHGDILSASGLTAAETGGGIPRLPFAHRRQRQSPSSRPMAAPRCRPDRPGVTAFPALAPSAGPSSAASWCASSRRGAAGGEKATK